MDLITSMILEIVELQRDIIPTLRVPFPPSTNANIATTLIESVRVIMETSSLSLGLIFIAFQHSHRGLLQ